MDTSLSIAVLVGSLRRASLSRKIAQAAMSRAPRGMNCSIVEIGNLPLYNEDLETDPPAAWQGFRHAIAEADGVLFVTPEYNRSLPGGLKNAIDVASRPGGKSVWDGLPAAVISVTPFKLGAFGANHALRQTFVFLNMPVLQQPEAYIGGARELFDSSGELSNPDTGAFLEKFMSAFGGWVEKTRRR